MNLKIRKIILFLIASSITLLQLAGCTSKSESTGTVDSTESYIKDNNYTINLKDDSDFLKGIIGKKDYKLIVSGEVHGFDVNEDLKLSFIKNLSKNYNLKYYIGEFNYVVGIYYNKYLESGSDSDLKALFSISPNKTAEWYENAKKTYEFYKSLPNDKKFKIIGIDTEGASLLFSLNYLSSMISSKNIPDEIKVINSFKDINSLQDYNKLTELALNLKSDMKSKQEIYKSTFGEDYTDFYIIVSSMITEVECNKLKKQNGQTTIDDLMVREKQILDNFNCLYNKLPKGLYFGQWGGDHINLAKTGFDSFINHLNEENEDLKGKILSIRYDYYMGREDKLFEKLSPYMKDNIVLFDLAGKNSPFSENLKMKDFQLNKNTTGDLPVSNYFQGIILIKSYKEVTPKKL